MEVDTELVTPSDSVSNYEANYEASYEANYEASYESSQEASHEANYTANHEANHKANHETNYEANDETNHDTNDEASVTTTSGSRINNRKLLSPVWKHFTLIASDEPNKDKAKCNYCKKEFSQKQSSGTTHLHRHLKSCIKYKKALGSSNSNSKNTRGQTQLTFNQSTNWVYSQEKSRMDLVNMIIGDELSFQFSEHSGFLTFVKGLRPNFKVCSADTIRRDTLKLYQDKKTSIRNILQNVSGRISLTTDVWTSQQQLSYSSVTVHFIDKDWKLFSFLMSFRLIRFPHTGVNIASSIKSSTDDFLITTKVLYFILLYTV